MYQDKEQLWNSQILCQGTQSAIFYHTKLGPAAKLQKKGKIQTCYISNQAAALCSFGKESVC